MKEKSTSIQFGQIIYNVLLRTTNDIQPFLFLIMFPFDFQYFLIIYINFKFYVNFIKHYIYDG
jgi:hypothetical protein